MKRVAGAGVLLLLLASWQVRAGSHGAAFSYKENRGEEAIFHPLIAPDIGVTLVKGPREINKGEFLVCKPGREDRKFTAADGREATISVLTLTCGERVFAVQSIHFEEQ